MPHRAHLNRRAWLALAAGAALLALLALAPAALADTFTPESGGSPQAEDIDTLYKMILYVAIVIFLIVEGTLVWALVKYRARRHGPEPAQIRGNTPLEIGWTIGATVIVLLIAVVTFIYLDDINDPAPSDSDAVTLAALGQPEPPGDAPSLNIDVNGQQFLWRYDYPGDEQLYSYYEMVVPTGTTVTLDLRASDVVHSWWIPKLGGKADAVPGHTNETWFKIDKPGTYLGQCAELCGDGHADMRAAVRAVPPEEFEQWAEQRREDIKAAQEGLAQQREEREGIE